MIVLGMPKSRTAWFITIRGLPKRDAIPRIERQRDRRELTLVRYGQWPNRGLPNVDKRRKWHAPAVRGDFT